MTRALRLRAGALGLLLASTAACDGIGRAVVDHKPPPPMTGFMPGPDCPFRPECPEGFEEMELASSVVTRLHDPAEVPCSTDDSIDLSGPEALDGAALRCGTLRLALPDEDGECAYRAEGVSLDATTLRVASARSCVLELPGADVRNARIELTGPVTLVLGDRTRIVGSSFVGARTDAGAPLLELDLAEVERSAVGDEELPFEGTFSARHTMFTSSSARAHDVALESVVFSHAQLHFDRLDAADATFSGVRLDLGEAVIAGSFFDRVDIRSCSALLIAGSDVYKSTLRGCGDGKVRIYNSIVGTSTLDGLVESDSSNIEDVRFGVQAPTEVIQFGGVINKAAFCSDARSYRLGELANASCMSCTARDALEPGGACNVSEVDRVLINPEHCELLFELPECEDEDVPRHRPRPPELLP